MGEQDLGRGEGESRQTEQGRKPWSAPTLTVQSVDEVTLGTEASTNADGENNYWS